MKTKDIEFCLRKTQQPLLQPFAFENKTNFNNFIFFQSLYINFVPIYYENILMYTDCKTSQLE